MNIKAIGKALTNKVGGVMAAPKVAYHEAKSKQADSRYHFVKDMQAKRKSGAPISAKEQAQYEGVNSYYNKK